MALPDQSENLQSSDRALIFEARMKGAKLFCIQNHEHTTNKFVYTFKELHTTSLNIKIFKLFPLLNLITRRKHQTRSLFADPVSQFPIQITQIRGRSFLSILYYLTIHTNHSIKPDAFFAGLTCVRVMKRCARNNTCFHVI